MQELSAKEIKQVSGGEGPWTEFGPLPEPKKPPQPPRGGGGSDIRPF